MGNNTVYQHINNLIDEILNHCIIKVTSDTDEHLPTWEELGTLRNLGLTDKLLNVWNKQLSNYDYICPVGKSGLGLGVIAARKFQKPLIWIDGDGRVIPQSKRISRGSVAVLDSHSYLGNHFGLAYSRLNSRNASKIGFFCMALCDNMGQQRLELPEKTPTHLISVVQHRTRFIARFNSLGVSDEKIIDERLNDGRFWGRDEQ